MRKGRDLIGKPIVTYDTGEQVGKVADLLFDLERNQLLGVDSSAGEGLPPSPGVLRRDVQALGADAIIIASRTMIQPVDQRGDSLRRLQRDLKPKSLTLFTIDGRDLGMLGDVYFDEHSGEIQGYEVTGGAFAAAAFGTSFVPAAQQVKVGVAILFVPAETVNLMKESGPPAASDSQGEREAEPGARKFHEAGPLILSAPRTTEDTHGRRVHCTVRTSDNLIVAAQGQIVTDEVIKRARAHHAEEALKEAIIHPAEQDSPDGNGSSLLDRTRERVREETSHLLANTEKVWGKVKENVIHLVHRSGEHREERSGTTSEPMDVSLPHTERIETENQASSDRHP